MVHESLAGISLEAAVATASDPVGRLGGEIVSVRAMLSRSGLFGGSVGDLSVRIPSAEAILISPLVASVMELAVDDFLEVTLEGRILHKRARPTASAKMHLAIYRRRPDVNGIVHIRAPFATLLGICEVPIPPVTVDAIAFADVPRVAVRSGDGHDWPEQVSTALVEGASAALLCHEGMVAVGARLQEAASTALALEETSRILVLSQLLNQVPCSLAPEVVETLREDWF